MCDICSHGRDRPVARCLDCRTPRTLNPKPETPKPETRNPKPQTDLSLGVWRVRQFVDALAALELLPQRRRRTRAQRGLASKRARTHRPTERRAEPNVPGASGRRDASRRSGPSRSFGKTNKIKFTPRRLTTRRASGYDPRRKNKKTICTTVRHHIYSDYFYKCCSLLHISYH